MLLKIDHVKRRNGHGQLYIIATYPIIYINIIREYIYIGTVVLIRKRLMFICVYVIYTADVSHCSTAACVIYSSSDAIFHPLPPHYIYDTPAMSAHISSLNELPPPSSPSSKPAAIGEAT